MDQPASYSFEITLTNILYNKASNNLMYIQISTANKWTIRNSVLYGNTGTTLFYSHHSTQQTIQYCYIVHSGTIGGTGITYELCTTTASTLSLKPTQAISHYSTYLCPVPYEQGALEVPCQTMPEEQIISLCPPIPTTCMVITDELSQHHGILSQIFNLVISSLIVLA